MTCPIAVQKNKSIQQKLAFNYFHKLTSFPIPLSAHLPLCLEGCAMLGHVEVAAKEGTDQLGGQREALLGRGLAWSRYGRPMWPRYGRDVAEMW